MPALASSDHFWLLKSNSSSLKVRNSRLACAAQTDEISIKESRA
jgi:hypothetical protein